MRDAESKRSVWIQVTRDYYDRNAEEFFKNTINADMTDLYREFTSLLPKKAKILDLGCGAGRDMLYFKSKGFDVYGVDNSPELVRLARKYANVYIIPEDFLNLEFKEEFDGIWACASLLHIEKHRLNFAFNTILGYARKNGMIYTSFKYGDFEGVRSGRYFSDFTEDSIIGILKDIKVRIIRMWTTRDKRPGNDTKWLNILLERK